MRNLCIFVPELYKEYKNLKQAKENGGSDVGVNAGQSKSSAEGSTAKKVWVCNLLSVILCFSFYSFIHPPTEPDESVQEPDCWGAHLNRSSMPASTPKMTGEDRDGLKASALYYGSKLKSNLATLSKVRILYSQPGYKTFTIG